MQALPSQPVPPDRQPPSVGIGELEPLTTQLTPKDPILFHQIRNRLALLAIHPAGEDGEHHLEGGRADHGWSLPYGVKLVHSASAELWDITGYGDRRSGGFSECPS